MLMKNTRAQAFSLVELSIVLVILGLLVGGILAGQSLIRAAELRAVGAEYTRFRTAVAAYQDKYFSYPGDMANATSFWGTATNCPGTEAQPSSTPATCNGNSDGVLSETTPGSNEIFRFWQHLANAGLVEGIYTGVRVSSAANSSAIAGLNVPASKIANSGWTAIDYGTATISDITRPYSTSTPYSPSWVFEGYYGHVLIFGANKTNDLTNNPILMPVEAWNIDTKLDDGRSGLGKIRALEFQTSCSDVGSSTTVALAASANYDRTVNSPTCALIFSM